MPQAKEYRARKGARFNDRDAEIIGLEFDRLGTDCTADDVVAAAKGRSSPLHPYFVWDDTEAARKYRLEQARYYLRCVEIVIVREGTETQTRAWHHVSIVRDSKPARAYVHTLEIGSDSALSEQVIANALRELRGWKARYAEYQAVFGDVFAAIDKAAGKVKRKRAKVVA